jgi:hypothetical protein
MGADRIARANAHARAGCSDVGWTCRASCHGLTGRRDSAQGVARTVTVKDGICNIDWPNLRALEDKITETIKPYWEDTNRVVSLIGQGYLLSELNAIVSEELLQNNC